jgi:hypothetical protein
MQKNIKDIALGISIGLVTGLMWLYTRYRHISGFLPTNACPLCANSGYPKISLHKTERPPRGGLSEIELGL